MATEEIRVGDIGTVFEVTFYDGDAVLPIPDATLMEIVFLKPDDDETVVIKTAAFTTDGTDGKAQYVTQTVNDLDVSGAWKIQGYVELPAGKWHSTIGEFEVYENLRAS